MVFGQKLIIGLTMSVFGSLLSLTGYISAKGGNCSGALSFIEQPEFSPAGDPPLHGFDSRHPCAAWPCGDARLARPWSPPAKGRRMNTPRSIKRLGTSLLIGGQAVAATLRGRINRGELFEQMLGGRPRQPADRADHLGGRRLGVQHSGGRRTHPPGGGINGGGHPGDRPGTGDCAPAHLLPAGRQGGHRLLRPSWAR